MQIPGGTEPGRWNVYLKLSVGTNDVSQCHMRSVRFANPDIWNAGLGANYIGSIEVTPSDDPAALTYSGFGTPAESRQNIINYTLNGLQIVDGTRSYENEQGTPAAESGNSKIWLHQDANHLYVTAEYDTGAAAEVHNLHLKNQTNGENYWIYFASNGYIYFNHGEPAGILQKHSNGLIEFQIPFGDVMGLKPGVTISDVRYALQDSANEWTVLSDVTAKEPLTLEESITVYNTMQTVSLMQGASAAMLVLCDVPSEGTAFQWYHDGKAIPDATENSYAVINADAASAGIYSVTITKQSGASRSVDICQVKQVFEGVLHGDADGNGYVDRKDLALLRDYLLTKQTALKKPESADLNRDGMLTAADLSLLMRIFRS